MWRSYGSVPRCLSWSSPKRELSMLRSYILRSSMLRKERKGRKRAEGEQDRRGSSIELVLVDVANCPTLLQRLQEFDPGASRLTRSLPVNWVLFAERGRARHAVLSQLRHSGLCAVAEKHHTNSLKMFLDRKPLRSSSSSCAPSVDDQALFSMDNPLEDGNVHNQNLFLSATGSSLSRSRSSTISLKLSSPKPTVNDSRSVAHRFRDKNGLSTLPWLPSMLLCGRAHCCYVDGNCRDSADFYMTSTISWADTIPSVRRVHLVTCDLAFRRSITQIYCHGDPSNEDRCSNDLTATLSQRTSFVQCYPPRHAAEDKDVNVENLFHELQKGDNSDDECFPIF